MAEHAYDEFDLAASRPEAAVRSFGTPVRSEVTPEGWDDLESCPEYDFGPLRVRAPAQAQLRMADPDEMYSDAAFFVFPDGKVRLSVLAAPRGGRLWPQRAEEIAAAQANLGADVRSYTGEWGQELQITDDGETNWVIGVDGPRWMLLGRSTCPVGAEDDLSHTMRDMIRSSVVFRGNEPLPVRTPLPLREPGSFDADDLTEDRTEGPYAGVVTLILPKVEAPVAADPIDRQSNGHPGNGTVADSTGTTAGTATTAAAAVAASVPAASPDWSVAARAASGPAKAEARSGAPSAPLEPVAEDPAPRNDDDELGRRRLAADTAGAAPRKRGGLLSAAALVALVAIVGLTGLVLAMRGSTPGIAAPSVAAPRQVDERLTPKQTYPDDAYPAAPKAVPQAPAPKVVPPLAAGPAPKDSAPAPGVPAARPATPRVATPVRSNAVPANGASKPLANANAARTPSTVPSRSTSAPAVAEPARPGPGHEAASDDYSGGKSHGARPKSRGYGGDQGDGPIDALSNSVLGVVPGLG